MLRCLGGLWMCIRDNAIGMRRLDSLILSHHDIEHDGGFQSLAAVGTDKLLAGQPEFYPTAEFCQEDKWQWDGVDFELLRPSENSGKEDNARSCVLRVVANGKVLLINGDLGVKGEASLIEKSGNALYSKVLVLGHHGSSTASSGSFLHTVSPQ
ncbi:ComEC/Rec2 family competence protein, partial [Neisseria sp. P0020.S005]|uniref:ComEC/Rec2 family competence protein n=1 Tax=Neisseria sp. P0020.S005 TaxID=3436810 RepID=UPI003F80CC1F